MSFKKIIPEVKEALESIGITGLEGLSKDLFAQYKSGSHLLVVSSAMDDTIPGIITSVFHKVNRAFEGSPRAIIVCSTIDEAERVFERMQRPARKLDVTIDLAHDKGNILQQRNDIFDGTEIVIATPKRLHELYLQNGINFNLLELFVVTDLEQVLLRQSMEIKRSIESLNKAQLLFTVIAPGKRTDAFIEELDLPIRILEAE